MHVLKDSEGSSSEALVAAERLSELRELALRRIREAAGGGTLERNPRLAYILYRWLEWASPSEPRAWVADLITRDAGLLIFVRAIATMVTTSGEYSTRQHYRIRGRDITTFVDAEVIKARVHELPTAAREENADVMEPLLKALTQIEEGVDDEDPRVWPVDEDDARA